MPPFHDTVVPFAELGLPAGAHLAQIMGEVEGGARAVRTVHGRDFLGRESAARD